MNKHRCKVCSYIYDPAQHENTAFEDLPDDWTCPTCGATKSEFEVIHQLGEEYTGGEAQEKHVPVIGNGIKSQFPTSTKNDTVTVKVGSVPHPMEEAHYITAIELYDGDTLIKKKELNPGEEPIVTFEDIQNSDNLKALAYCNLHGVWAS